MRTFGLGGKKIPASEFFWKTKLPDFCQNHKSLSTSLKTVPEVKKSHKLEKLGSYQLFNFKTCNPIFFSISYCIRYNARKSDFFVLKRVLNQYFFLGGGQTSYTTWEGIDARVSVTEEISCQTLIQDNFVSDGARGGGDLPSHEFHEACHSVTFIVVVNSHQR